MDAGDATTRQLVHEFSESASGKSLMAWFKDDLGTVEILGKSDRVERVYFKIDPLKKEHWKTRHLQVRFLIKISCVLP
jgi:hypothetical protein